MYIFPSLPRFVIPQHWFAGNAGLSRLVYLADRCLAQPRDVPRRRPPFDRDFREFREFRDFREFRAFLGLLDLDRRLETGRDLDLVGIPHSVGFPYGSTFFFLWTKKLKWLVSAHRGTSACAAECACGRHRPRYREILATTTQWRRTFVAS